MSTSSVTGFAADSPGQELKPVTYTLPPLGEHDVQIAITHCGLCYTDIQGIDDYYGITHFPFVPGHEVVGHVTAMGPAVEGLQMNERVGVGWQGRACMQCEWCLRGEEHLCDDIEHCATWDPYGGFSSDIVVDSRFAYPLPDGMPSEHAAALLCAGLSVFAPLQRYAPDGGLNVGVIGIGGLGHLAIQFAHALGNRVTAISSSPGKEKEARNFGADNFIHTDDTQRWQDVLRSFDLLLYTSHGPADWTRLLDGLKVKGRLVLVGFSDEPIAFQPLEVLVNQLSITGSLIGGRASMRAMLTFAHEHGIEPMVELMPMAKVNEAIQRLKTSGARYRLVLMNA